MKMLLKGRKGKKDNKGFTLVELIVVIAILAILAVALAPKLTRYLDKAKVTSDKDVVNTFYKACEVVLVDEDVWNTIVTLGGSYDKDVLTSMYERDGSSFTYNAKTSGLTDFEKEIVQTVGKKITFKSHTMTSGTPKLQLKVTGQGTFKLTCSAGATPFYELDTAEATPTATATPTP